MQVKGGTRSCSFNNIPYLSLSLSLPLSFYPPIHPPYNPLSPSLPLSRLLAVFYPAEVVLILRIWSVFNRRLLLRRGHLHSAVSLTTVVFPTETDKSCRRLDIQRSSNKSRIYTSWMRISYGVISAFYEYSTSQFDKKYISDSQY